MPLISIVAEIDVLGQQQQSSIPNYILSRRRTQEETIALARFSKPGRLVLDSLATPRHNCNECFTRNHLHGRETLGLVPTSKGEAGEVSLSVL
jgi:hypothetical protein